ncbi:hypothetical protein ACP4OV_014853 [Aristida adscensionis]
MPLMRMDSDESDVYSKGNPKTDSDWGEESEKVDDDDYDDEPPPSPRPPTLPPRRAVQPRPPLPRHPAPHQPQPPPPPQPRPKAEKRWNGGDSVIHLFSVAITAPSLAPPSLPAVAAKNDDDGRTTRVPAKRRTRLFGVEIEQ